MDLQKVIDTASKYPWRYGYGNTTNDPLAKGCGVTSMSEAAVHLGVSEGVILAFVDWWDFTLGREDDKASRGARKLVGYGYTIPAGPRLIRARRKTKRVRAYQYLRSL